MVSILKFQLEVDHQPRNTKLTSLDIHFLIGIKFLVDVSSK